MDHQFLRDKILFVKDSFLSTYIDNGGILWIMIINLDQIIIHIVEI